MSLAVFMREKIGSVCAYARYIALALKCIILKGAWKKWGSFQRR